MCIFVGRKLRKRIKELEVALQEKCDEVERLNAKLASGDRKISGLHKQLHDAKRELAKTPARGADGRYTSRRKQ